PAARSSRGCTAGRIQTSRTRISSAGARTTSSTTSRASRRPRGWSRAPVICGSTRSPCGAPPRRSPERGSRCSRGSDTIRWRRWTTSPRSWMAGSGRPSRASARAGRMAAGRATGEATQSRPGCRRTDMTAETTSTPETSQTTRTLYGHLTDWAQHAPDRVLVTQLDPAQGDAATDDVTRQLTPVTAAGLLERATALAAWLRERGVGEGDCIAVWLPAWVDSYAWQYAASAVGAHVIGVNTRYNVAEVSHVLVKARPAVLVAAHGFQRVDFLATLHRVAEG